MITKSYDEIMTNGAGTNLKVGAPVWRKASK